MLLPQAEQLVDVLLVHFVHIFVVGVLVLCHSDGPANNNVHGSAVRHHANIVVEDASCMKDGNRKAHDLLYQHLELVNVWVSLGVELVIDVVLTKREDGHEVSAGADGHLDEAFATAQNKLDLTRSRIQRFTCAANDDGDGASHAFTILPAFGKNVLARLSGNGSHTKTEGVLAVDGVSEVGVEGQESIGDAGKELREAQCFSRKRCKGAMRDDAVWVVAEDVLPSRLQLLRAMQAGGEV